MKTTIPIFVKPFLWSYDINALDLDRDRARIITNILNLGTKKATDWLFSVYGKEEIAEAILHPLPGEWNRKSLNFWSFILDVPIGNTSRYIP